MVYEAIKMAFSLTRLYKLSAKTGSHDPLQKTDLCKHIRSLKKQTYVQTQGQQLFYIAFRLYGDQELWPILAELNDIINPFIVPERIYIIPPNDLRGILQNFDYNGRRST